jgi:hypothetical protein
LVAPADGRRRLACWLGEALVGVEGEFEVLRPPHKAAQEAAPPAWFSDFAAGRQPKAISVISGTGLILPAL